MLNKTFFSFFLGFVAIIGVAYGVLIIAGAYGESRGVDNVAQPR
jgi:hypothetical protein